MMNFLIVTSVLQKVVVFLFSPLLLSILWGCRAESLFIQATMLLTKLFQVLPADFSCETMDAIKDSIQRNNKADFLSSLNLVDASTKAKLYMQFDELV